MIKEINESNLSELNNLTSYFNIIISKKDLDQENNTYIGYFDNDKLVAFLNYAVYYERAEINYIFFLEAYRHHNIATKLLLYMFENNKSLDNITLEVRKSNIAAIKLYEANGFRKCTIRKNYYGSEDAIMMIKKFGD